MRLVMVSEQTREIFVFLEKVGLTDVILPFFIAFALLYGAFDKTMVFGSNKEGEPNKKVNMIVAGIISLTFVISLNLVKMMTKIVWIFAVVIVALLCVMIVMGAFGANLGEIFKKEKK